VHDSRGIEIVNFTISLALSAGMLMASAGTPYRLVPAHFYPWLSLTVSCFSEIQIGFTFLVPAHPGSPGKRAVKRLCVVILHLEIDNIHIFLLFRATDNSILVSDFSWMFVTVCFNCWFVWAAMLGLQQPRGCWHKLVTRSLWCG